MGSLLSSAGSAPKDLFGSAPQISQYLNQAPASDVPGGGSSILSNLPGIGSISSLFNGGGDSASSALKLTSTGASFLPPPFDLAAIPLALGSAIPSLISMFSGRNSTGPGSATADIASAGSSYSDPIIKLLSAGAGALPSGVPISASDGSASPFGSYFDAARRAEDLVRWGAGGPTDKKAESLDATTLKNALTEMGNPGKAGTSTLLGLQKAWNSFQEKNPPGSAGYDQLLQLTGQMSPTEAGIFKQFFGGSSPNPSNLPSPTGNPLFGNQNPGGSSSNPLSALGAIAPLLIAGQNINPINPIRLPDQSTDSVGPGNNQQKAAKKQNPNLIAQLLALLAQNGQSQQDSSTLI